MKIMMEKFINYNMNNIDLKKIIKKAETALQMNPIHITDVIAPMSPGGNHDYYSNGDYWWPNPDTLDGLPYIQRDGETNPENFDAHRLLVRKLRTAVADLAMAYHLTKSEVYAKGAILLLKEFFLNPSTRMNPHLLYAQAIPGICTGRGIGLIDTLHLIDIPVAIKVLEQSPHLTKDILSGLKEWFTSYLTWMTTHEYGLEEMNAKNNHGVCWLVQVAVFARFANNHDLLHFCRERYKNVILPDQMAKDGSFPLELVRTKPYSYSIFVLDNMVTLCQVLSTEEENLWEFELEDKRSIKKGLEFLYPYLEDKSKWPYATDIQHFQDWPVQMSFLLFAGLALNNKRYIDLWNKLDADPSNLELRRNIAIRQPMLWLINSNEE